MTPIIFLLLGFVLGILVSMLIAIQNDEEK